MVFKIIQWNCRGYYTRLERIQQIIRESQPNILCLQETNYKPDHIPKLKHFHSYNHYRISVARASGGVTIFVSDKLYTKKLSVKTDLECVAVNIWCPTKITVCNIYIPPDYNLRKNELENLVDQLPTPYILVGDFNSHSQMWGSKTTYGRGNLLKNS